MPSLQDLLRERVPQVPVTHALIAANVLVFIAMVISGAGLWHSSNAVQLAWGANFGPATQDGAWWRLASAMFLHFGLVHLALNMWALWDAGQLVERMYGHQRFAAIYLVGGLSGNLLSLFMQGNKAVSGGASGAIFGVFGALLVFLWRERSRLHPGEFRWLFWGAAGFAGVTIGLGFVVTGIDNSAHVGGLLGGTLAGLALARPLNGADAAPLPRRLAAALALGLAVAGLILNIPKPTYRWSEETDAREEIGRFLREDADISRTFGSILQEGKRRGLSFDEMAGRIEADIAERYEESFEELSQLRINPAAPSAATLETLRRYAELRRNASRALAEGLRARDPEQIREALELARKSQELAQPDPARQGAGAR